jgi:hypothetical protein
MAFIPTISACLNGCTGITINDTTGFYNSSTNTNGWNDGSTLWKTTLGGDPHVTAATISISLNGGAATPINVLNKVQESVFPEFELYQYTPVDSTGSTFTLADGYYDIVYTITDDTGLTYTADTTFVVFCNVACCVSKLAARVADELCNNCDSEAYNDFLIADGMLQALKATAESLGTQEFTKLLNKLQKLCNQTSASGGCGCGCS